MIYMLIIPKSMHPAQFSHKQFQPVSLNACKAHSLGRVPAYSLKNANVIVTLALSCLKPLTGSGLALSSSFHSLVLPCLQAVSLQFAIGFAPNSHLPLPPPAVFPELQALFCHKLLHTQFLLFEVPEVSPSALNENLSLDLGTSIIFLTTQR